MGTNGLLDNRACPAGRNVPIVIVKHCHCCSLQTDTVLEREVTRAHYRVALTKFSTPASLQTKIMKRSREEADDATEPSKQRKVDSERIGAEHADVDESVLTAPHSLPPSGGVPIVAAQDFSAAELLDRDAAAGTPGAALRSEQRDAEDGTAAAGPNGVAASNEQRDAEGKELEEEDDDDDDDAPLMPLPQRARVRKGSQCPYLDTISRQVNESCSVPE